MVGWCDFHDSYYAAWKAFQMSIWGWEKEREGTRSREGERERESRLSGLDGDNFHIHDWEETFLLSGANTKFSLWQSQTNICFHLGLCVCVDEKMKEVRQRERLSGIKCHTYCEILLIKKIVWCCQWMYSWGWNGPWNASVSDGSLHWSTIKTFILSRRKTVLLIHLLSAPQCIWKLNWGRRISCHF